MKITNFLKFIGVVFILLIAQRASASATLPQAYVDTSMPIQTGATINLANDCSGLTNCYTSFQNAVAAAQPGDTVVVKAGDSFTGNFYLPAKTNPNNKWIIIESSKVANFPVNTRVNPNNAVNMPKLIAYGSGPALVTKPTASYYRIIGIEFTDSGVPSSCCGPSLPGGGYGGFNYGLINFGETSDMVSADLLPTHIVLDRDYIHGQPTSNVKYGVHMDGVDIATIDSYLSDLHLVDQDSQAIAGFNGPGPIKIVDNYLEGGAENILFGGATPFISGMITKDIEIRNNYIFKPLSWKIDDPSYAGIPWAVKNLVEIKEGDRVLIQGNVIKNIWIMGQTGYAFVIKSSAPNTNAGWIYTANVTVRDNIVDTMEHGINVCGDSCDGYPTLVNAAGHVDVINNLWLNIDSTSDCCQGFAMILDNDHDVTFDHNTVASLKGGNTVTADSSGTTTNPNFVFTNNIVPYGPYGIVGTNKLPGEVVKNNGVIDLHSPPTGFGTGNYLLNNYTAVGYVNNDGTLNGNYSLTTSSPFKGKATDGSDIGVDWNTLTAATTGVVSGNNTNPYVPPVSTVDTIAPTVSLTDPAQASTISGAVIVSAVAADNVGVAGVQFKVDGTNFGAEIVSAPYQTSLDTTKLSNGTHTITAVARDAAGNSTTSSAVTVTVSNASLTTGAVYASPTSSDFGSVQIGQTSPELDFKLFNPTASQIQTISPSVTGDFSIKTNFCSQGAVPNTHCDVYVVFTPTAAGTRTGSLTFILSGGLPTQTIALSGTGAVVSQSGLTNAVNVVLGTSSLVQGQTTQANATALDSTGAIISGKNFTWQSSNLAVAAVTPQGVVVAVSSGTATITATVDGKSGMQVIVVSAASNGQTVPPVTIPSNPATNPNTPNTTVSSFPTGTLVNDHGTIFLIRKGVKIGFTNANAFLSMGYKFSDVVAGDASNIPTSGYNISSPVQEHPWGTWLLYNHTVYYSTQSGMIGVPSISVLQSNGGDLFHVLPANAADISLIQNSNLPVMSPGDARVY